MTDQIPNGIEEIHILKAIKQIDAGVPNNFDKSTRYDVLFEGKRYAPKAVIGVAAEILTGKEFDPYSFKGGINSKCFKILKSKGFSVITKGNKTLYPDEITKQYYEGSITQVLVNRYERNVKARQKCIDYYKALCVVCGFNFKNKYGIIGEDFIHIHHVTPLASISEEYVIDPIEDLKPVCPNCHCMLHKRDPPFTIEELQELISKNSEL
jgi:5-methylcytosine-specific restriction protein A